MKRSIRIALIAINAFTAVTAIGGGIALASGVEGERFPAGWLAGTPFDGYVVPGLILAVAVGGSAAVALFAALLRPHIAGRTSIIAGLVLIGWIIGEIAILTADGELTSPTELFYQGVGLAMVGLGYAAVRAERAPAATVRGGAWRVSRKERLGLAIHRGLDRWLSPLGVWVYRRTRGNIARPWKVDALLLPTRGRRTGNQRTVVLQYFPDGEAMIVVAANDGGRSHPGWYFNLTADPAATVEVMGRRLSVRAEVLPADEASEWWPGSCGAIPNYERYARATSRSLPIVRLVPI